MTTEKTIREAYESIGSTPQVGDIIDHREPSTWQGYPPITWVDGWYFDTSTHGDLGSLVHNASVRKMSIHWIITRNSKQIYPKVEVDTRALSRVESSYAKTKLVQGLILVCTGMGHSGAARLEDLISKLIDAKIKEKIGDK